MVAVFAVVVIRVFPTLTEYYAISKTVKGLTDTPSVERVRTAFDQASRVNDIVSVTGRDLDIVKDDAGKMDIRFEYRREVNLLGPVSLVIAYSGGSK